MLDLVSTRPGVDTQAARCARLLAAIIADAVRQASTRPLDREIKQERNNDCADWHPALGIWFLFDEESPFDKYAQYIGLSAKDFREALLGTHELDAHLTRPIFTNADRRVIKARHRWYLLEKQELLAAAQKLKEAEGALDGV